MGRNRLHERRVVGADWAPPSASDCEHAVLNARAWSLIGDVDRALVDLQARTIRRHESARRLDITRAWGLIRRHYGLRTRLSGEACSPLDALHIRYDDMTDAALRRSVARLAKRLRAQARLEE